MPWSGAEGKGLL